MKTVRFFMAIAITALFCCGNVQAQRNNGSHFRQDMTPEEFRDMQIKAMEKRLDLDEETSAKFTPLYTEYLEALSKITPATSTKNKKKLSDDEKIQNIKDRLAAQRKAIELKESYFDKFKEILSVKQLEKFYMPAAPGGRMPNRNMQGPRGNRPPMMQQQPPFSDFPE